MIVSSGSGGRRARGRSGFPFEESGRFDSSPRRFERLVVKVDIEPEVRRAAVPHLLLQPLVENAVRHGIGGRTDTSLLAIHAGRDAGDLGVELEDDGPGVAPPGGRAAAPAETGQGPGPGLGLANVRERLGRPYDGRGSLELAEMGPGGCRATVRLPFRRLDRGWREAVTAIRELEPALVFLDIQMPELDGFGVLEKVGSEHMPEVIFVTAYDGYALDAFAVAAFDFLLEPFEDERFEAALGRALDPARFVRIHRSTRVEVGRVAERRPPFHGEYQVVLESGVELKPSRGYREALPRLLEG